MAETTYVRVPNGTLHVHLPTRNKYPVEGDVLACGRRCQLGWKWLRRKRKPRGEAFCKRCEGAK